MDELFPVVFSRDQKIKALERELGYRRSVYGRRVGDGKMTQAKADYEGKIFEAILQDFKDLVP